MTKKALLEAVRKAEANGEALRLWQAVEWRLERHKVYSYGLMTYKEYTTFINGQVAEHKRAEEEALKDA